MDMGREHLLLVAQLIVKNSNNNITFQNGNKTFCSKKKKNLLQ